MKETKSKRNEHKIIRRLKEQDGFYFKADKCKR